MAEKFDIVIEQGATWSLPVRWWDVIIGGAISNTVANPTVITTTAAHGLSTGDTVKIKGSNSTPNIDGVHTVTVLSTTTFSIPVNVTEAGTAGKVRKAMNLTGYTARMKVKDDAGTVQMALTEADGIALGGATGTITLSRSATLTAAYIWTRGVYDLELVTGAGVVTRLLEGAVVVTPERTT